MSNHSATAKNVQHLAAGSLEGYICDTEATLSRTQLEQMANAREYFAQLSKLLTGSVLPAIGRSSAVSARVIGLLEAIQGQSGSFLAKERREHLQAHAAREVAHG